MSCSEGLRPVVFVRAGREQRPRQKRRRYGGATPPAWPGVGEGLGALFPLGVPWEVRCDVDTPLHSNEAASLFVPVQDTQRCIALRYLIHG